MMSRNAFLSLAFAAALAAMPASAKPNFSGSWKMVAEKSDFGPMPAPTRYEQAIDHKDPNLKISVSQASERGEMTQDFTYNTGGKETTNTTQRGTMKSKAKWNGDALVVDSVLDIQGNAINMSERYEMSEDGKNLTVTRKMATPNGDLEMKVVMEKQ